MKKKNFYPKNRKKKGAQARPHDHRPPRGEKAFPPEKSARDMAAWEKDARGGTGNAARETDAHGAFRQKKQKSGGAYVAKDGTRPENAPGKKGGRPAALGGGRDRADGRKRERSAYGSGSHSALGTDRHNAWGGGSGAKKSAHGRTERARTVIAPDGNTYTLYRDEETVGLFRGTGRGFGFLMPTAWEGVDPTESEDIFIPASGVGAALDGDRVRVRYHRYRAHRDGEERILTEGEVTEILEGRRETAIGTLAVAESGYGRRARQYAFFIPDSGRLPGEIPVRDRAGARAGEKVEIRLIRGGGGRLSADVTAVFGDAESRAANYEAILAEYEVPQEFSPETLAEAEAAAARPLTTENGRISRTRELILTIDGPHAKDLDDAVSLRAAKDGGYLLSVHIADVSEYVTPKSALDRTAMERGTSLYFVDRVVPMLPPALSNGACSLNAGEDKYALTADILLDRAGNIRETTLSRTTIRSRVRGVYDEVNDLFEKGDASPFAEKYKALRPMLSRMRKLYTLLAKKSRARGALELDRPEAAIFLDESGDVARIALCERGDAERMIEQFMLTANEGVATLLSARGFPCVYRVHDAPAADRLADFITYAHNLGLDTRPLCGESVSPRDFAAVLDEARERGLGNAVSYMLLRTMAKAVYSDACRGHFGLGIEKYAHFTSPIRRLSDLSTHRMIKAVLLDGERPEKYRAYAARAASAATEGELRALEAERAIEALYKTVYMAGRVGETADAVISSVTSFGIFCELPDTCEGLIPREELGDDARFMEKTLTMEAGGRLFRVGDPIRIRIADADVESRRVRFAPAEPQ